MNNDHTKDLTDSEKLDLLLADMADVKTRLAALEAFNGDRSRDTRPMLAQVQQYVAELSSDMRDVKSRVQRMDRRFETLAGDMVDLRNRQSDVEARVDEAERRPS